MHDLIRRILRRMRPLLASGTGKRRRAHRRRPRLCPPFTAVRHHSAPVSPQLPLHRSPYGLLTSLDGAESVLVRPYLAAHEREAALRPHRRALVVVVGFGIDLDQRLVGAQKTAA
ncbi:hypothetical protein GCM10010269_80810 [Streptomyces humidus]|uniref:Uncharacterized protein n=1 Tax=Streptomyces humidus TaxID=52259 RepID=A0A918GDQ6_9ACTN|nr:hypothetical protein [Streptomyces humidus]GGS30041.1 hypothetical protein GCM10010269_80810 [Streptomyces humidus]